MILVLGGRFLFTSVMPRLIRKPVKVGVIMSGGRKWVVRSAKGIATVLLLIALYEWLRWYLPWSLKDPDMGPLPWVFAGTASGGVLGLISVVWLITPANFPQLMHQVTVLLLCLFIGIAVSDPLTLGGYDHLDGAETPTIRLVGGLFGVIIGQSIMVCVTLLRRMVFQDYHD